MPDPTYPPKPMHLRGIDTSRNAWNDCLAACEAHYQPYIEALRQLVEASATEESEHGYPFNFRLREALAAARQLLDGEGGA